VQLWEVQSRQALATLQGRSDKQRTVCFSPDGTLVASGSSDGTITLWAVQTGAFLQTLRSDGPYARMNISGATGLTEAQRTALKALGAIEEAG
jgi:WD40 repeat protein